MRGTYFYPGCQKTEADAESRAVNLDTERKLNSVKLQRALARLKAKPSMYLFASRVNRQLPCYVAYRTDPHAHAVDAFWTKLNLYAFPPFSVITRVLQKRKQDGGTVVMVVPCRPTQVWWLVLTGMTIASPVLLHGPKLLSLPSQSGKEHPMERNRTLKLMACIVSGSDTGGRILNRSSFLFNWFMATSNENI